MIIVLASSSPRRIELLKMIGITDFSVIPPHIDESLPDGVPPEDAVRLLALKKAAAVAPEATALAAEALGVLGAPGVSGVPGAGALPGAPGTDGGADGADTAAALSAGAASDSSNDNSCSPLIIAADTLVYLDGAALGKPRDAGEARGMLRALSGHRHTVYTGVVLLCPDKSCSFAEKSDVYFRELSDEEIAWYVATGDPLDKAGAYGAQGPSAMFIERIDGDFWNVVGLPLCRLSVELRKLN